MKLFLIILFVLSNTLVFAEIPNYCHDDATNAEWESIAKRATANSKVMGLYKLRKDLCARVDHGELSVEEATEIFEKERERVVDSLKREQV